MILLLGPLQALAAPTRAAASKASARAGAIRPQLRRATEHFRAGRYAEARELFDALLAAKTPLPQRATIAFNAAVSSYALEDYADALKRFDAVASEAPELAAQARVNAGFCALRLGDLDAAAARAEPSDPGDAAAETRRQELLAELGRARLARAQEELGERLDAGFAAISRREWPLAREHLRRAIALGGDDHPDALADAEYGLGVVALEQREPAAARRHFQASLRHRPGDGRTTLALARAAEDAADPRGAAAAYESALGLALERDQQEDAERSLLRLYPLPATGVSALLSLGVGADGNATQSGSGDVLGGVAQTEASAYVSGLVDLGLMLRSSRRSAIGLNYSGDLLALLNPSVDELSLQAHELLARGQWAPVPGLRLRLDAGAAYVLSGLDPIRSFEWDAVLGLLADVDTSASSRARLQLGARLVSAELDYLDGQRLQAIASQLWYLGSWELSLQALLRYSAAGVQELALGGDAFDACSPNCDRARYRNPASYWSPGLGLAAAWQPSSAWRFSAATRAEYRGYLDPATLPSFRDSQKTREDWRFRAQLGAELGLDAEGRFRVTLDQTLLVNRSNVAFDAGDPEHRYDLGDKNFLQPTTELGISANLP